MRGNETHLNKGSLIDGKNILSESNSYVTQPGWVSDEEPEAPEEAPPSPNYVPGPKRPPSPNYVHAPEHPPSPPLLDDASPTALSPGYMADSDSEEDPEEDPEEDHANYPADGGDGDDESFDNDDDDDDVEEDDKDDEEEEDHSAPADSSAVPTVDHVPSVEDAEAFETDKHAPTPPTSPHRIILFSKTIPRTAWVSVQTQTPIPFPSKAEVDRLLALPTPPPSPLTPLSSPLPQIPSPQLHVSSPPLPLPSSPTTSPTYAEAPLGYRVAEIRIRDASRPLLLPSTSHMTDIPEAKMPSQKRACFTTPASRLEVGESSTTAARRPGPTLEADLRSAAIEAHVKTLEAHVATLMAQTSSLHNQLTTALDRIQTLEARDPEPQDELDEAGSSYISRNGDDSHDSGTSVRRQAPLARECTHTDFLKCQPLNFKGTEGDAGLTQSFEKIESVFHISNCTTVTHEVAYAMPWKTLKMMMTDKYCPRGKIKKLEIEMWNLKVKGTDVVSYNQRLQELSLMCSRMFPEESDEIEKYVGGLPDIIHGSLMASKSKTMQDAIEFATELMNKKISTIAERQAENKRKFEDTSRNNKNQQQPFKRNNVAWSYTTGPGEKKPYRGSKPMCPKCNYHHDGQCAPKCTNCKRTGHSARDYRSPAAANNNQRDQGTNQRVLTCFKCGAQVGNAGENPDANVVTGTFLLNNRYASILFDTGTDRSFVSNAFSSLIDIIPSTLDRDYDVELADGKIIGVNTIIRGCTLNFLNHPFKIDLIPIELGSFDIIIGMDWLSMYHAVIVYAEKIVRIPWGNETLIIRGDGNDNGHGS
ncbi:putative reverse transcriptase domain-containing protein [Tanacetum coccineum]|uniref:Reverse transcriptase domain-containing protein n=1 Tax=Tanacetum coccineum TaxID=301880 RepID=A0ABQ5CRF4_9ASTR